MCRKIALSLISINPICYVDDTFVVWNQGHEPRVAAKGEQHTRVGTNRKLLGQAGASSGQTHLERPEQNLPYEGFSIGYRRRN